MAGPGDDGFDDGVVVSLGGAKKKRVKTSGGGGSTSGGDDAHRAFPDMRDCPVKALGMVGERYGFMTPSRAPRYYLARDMASSTVVAALFDGETGWLRQFFPSEKPSGFVTSGATNFLIRECVKLGFFSPEDDLRGAGAWRMDDGALLLHLGAKVLVFRERGSRIAIEEHPPGRYGRYIYPAGPAQAFPGDEPATADEVKDLFDLYATWNWEHAQAPLTLLGFLGCAFIPGALRHRPHAWVTGDTSTGKTTLENLNRALLGSSAMGFSDATKMAIAFRLAGAAKSVWLDEIERDVDASKQEAIVELARIASSDGQQGIVRGAPGGASHGYRIRACVYLSSILPAPLKPQDKTRIHVMDLRPLLPTSAANLREFEARIARMKASLGPRLLTRVIHGFWRFQANEHVVESVMIDLWRRGGRVVDQLGTLVAMAFTLLSDDVVSAGAVQAVLEYFAPEDIVGRADEGEAPRCVNHLLTSTITYELERGRETRTIGEMIVELQIMADSRAGRFDNSARHKDLKRHGLALVNSDDGQGLVVAHDHEGTARLFAGKRWQGGVWPAVLKRLPGAFATKNAVRFNGIQKHGTFIPLSSLPLAFDRVESDEVAGPAPASNDSNDIGVTP